MTPWFSSVMAEAVPAAGADSAVQWCEENVKLIGSAKSESFRSSITPWLCEPIETACSGDASHETLVGPVQSGKSAAGECALCVWLARESNGDVQYNWENDAKARQRWDERFERILQACRAVMKRAPDLSRTAGRWKKGSVLFAHCNFTMQGVFTSDNLDSTPVRFQVNEEVHNWTDGRLAKAYNRTTAHWNSVIFNISNAGKKDDQLHQALLTGTNQAWEVKCPGCGLYHVMRTRWDDKRPDLGGLRYDSEGCKLPDGGYDYNKLAPTIRYQMPCGLPLHDDPTVRKALSMSGRYGAPRNKGARPSKRSHTLEAVSVDYIPWVNLVEEKHAALRALRQGNPEPYIRYLQEREVEFWDPEQRPVVGRVTVEKSLKMWARLPDRVASFAALDRQRGRLADGEFPHWWLVIRDFNLQCDSRLAYAGKCLTDADAVAAIELHKVEKTCVVADSGDGDSTTHVYQFCLQHGYNAIKGADDASFAHPGSGRKIFSPEKPLHTMLNLPPTAEHARDEPLFWHYSKHGVRERLSWLRASTKWEVPGDAPLEYHEHMESEEEREGVHPKTNQRTTFFVQVKKRNDMYVDECYIAMMVDMAGLMAGKVAPPKK